MDHSLIHSPLCCFQDLAIMNKAALNIISVLVFVCIHRFHLPWVNTKEYDLIADHYLYFEVIIKTDDFTFPQPSFCSSVL